MDRFLRILLGGFLLLGLVFQPHGPGQSAANIRFATPD